MCFQREVEVEIEGADKNGAPTATRLCHTWRRSHAPPTKRSHLPRLPPSSTHAGVFMGTLHLPDKRNLAVVLLEGGLARRVGAAADRSTHAFELAAAEESAQGASLKVWENYSEEEDAAAAAAAAEAAREELEPVPDEAKQVVQLELRRAGLGALPNKASKHAPSALCTHARG